MKLGSDGELVLPRLPRKSFTHVWGNELLRAGVRKPGRACFGIGSDAITAVPFRRCGVFLHSPFPSSEIFRTFPKREELLRSLLNADLIGECYSLGQSPLSKRG